MLEPVTRRLLLPLHERLRGRGTLAAFHSLARSQDQSPEAIRDLQLKKLRQLLRHCRAEVPFYRDRLAAHGLNEPAGLSDLSDLARLPALEREDVRADLNDLTAASFRGALIRYNTGGSTGEPLVFYTDKHKEACHNAYKMRCRQWFGIRPGDRQVDFWGSPIELDRQSRLRIWKDRWLLNQVLLSAFDLTEQRLHDYVEFLHHFKPRLIYGYPTVIYRVAQFIKETADGRPRPRPKLVACTSEMLLDHQRATIAEIFGCPVANEYGSRDGGLIAHECPSGRMHIAAEHVYVEVDAPDVEGVGDLLITNLDGYGMPLLRYRIGDRGRLSDEPCDCGLPLPVLAELAGRTNDFVVGAQGRLIHSLAPVYVLRDIPQIKQFKLIQREDLGLEIQIVAREPLSDAQLDEIRQKMAKIFGFPVAVAFHMLPVIAPEKSGKYRWVVSHARSGAQ